MSEGNAEPQPKVPAERVFHVFGTDRRALADCRGPTETAARCLGYVGIEDESTLNVIENTTVTCM